MDIRWLTCMVWIYLHKRINATVSIPLKSSLPTVPIANLSRTEQLATISYLHGTVKEKLTTTAQITEQATQKQSLFATQKLTELSTMQVSPIAMKTKLSTIHKSTPSIHRMTTIISRNSIYVPVINGTESNLNSNGIPLIILVPSALGGGVLLILVVMLCCCCYRRFKRRKLARIFKKYYRPTLPANLENDLETTNSNLRDSQMKVMKLTIENKEEQFIDSKSSVGISNEGFSTSHSLPQMNIKKKSNSDQSVENQNDSKHSTSNSNVKDLDIQPSDVTSDCRLIPVHTEDTIAMETISSSLAPVDENSPSDDQRASLLILQNLDDVLDNECVDDENKLEKETNNDVTKFKDNQDYTEGDGEYFVVIYPFHASNADELSLDVGATVSVIDGKPSAWSWVENKDGDTGWFPTQFLVQNDSDQTSEGPKDLHSSNQTGYSVPDKRRLQFAVLQSFSGSNPDQISLAQYDIVSVIQNSSTGWSWVYEPSVGSGWFPTNYLEPLVFPKKKSTTQKSSSNRSDYLDVIDEGAQYVYATSEEIQRVKNDGHYQEYEAKAYRASHAYTKSNEDELAFEENETILVLQETDTGWWRGSTYLGEGWFPATFVEDPLMNEDTIIEDSTNVNTNQSSPDTTADCYDYVDARCRKDGRNYSGSVSPYEVTEIVTQKNQSKQENKREAVHQVPKPISLQATRNHRSRGKGRVLKPCRPAPLPPSGSRPTVSPPDPAVQVPDLPQEIQTTPLTQSHPSASNSSTVETLPFSETLQTDASSSITSPKPSSITQTSQSTNTNIQKNEIVQESENVEGVVIVRPQKQSRDAKSKLIKVTKRRSVVNPNPCALPPNRPVPIPPPRKATNPSKSVDNHQRTRPTKMPRNKKEDIRDIDNPPKHGPERPPPRLPENLNEFRQKRLSSCKESSTNEGNMLSKQADNERNTFTEQSGTEQNDGTISDVKNTGLICSSPISKQQNSKSGNDDEVQSPGNRKKEMASADTGKISPKPKPRRRSRDNQPETQMTITETKNSVKPIQSLFNYPPTECEARENGERQNTKDDQEDNEQDDTLTYQRPGSQSSRKSTSPDTTPEVPVRSRSLSEEASDVQPKSPPQIKPRSKSLANLFSSTSKELNSERRASSSSQLSHSQEDNSVMNHTQDHAQFDHNGNINKLDSAKRASPTPPRPKPKSRRAKAKQDDREIDA